MMTLKSLTFLTAVALVVAGPALAQAPVNIQPKPAAAAPAPAKPAPARGVDADEAIDKANAFFNASPTMVADFVQIGADGRRAEGKLYVQKPGKMRFEYARPATLEIVADGTSVAVRDRKLATQDLYLIGQTPLKFLLKAQIDLSRDVKILGIKSDAKTTTISVEDKATLGGTSKIKLMFDTAGFGLKQWQVVDPQGYETLVSVFNVDQAKKPDSGLFRINTERMLNTNN